MQEANSALIAVLRVAWSTGRAETLLTPQPLFFWCDALTDLRSEGEKQGERLVSMKNAALTFASCLVSRSPWAFHKPSKGSSPAGLAKQVPRCVRVVFFGHKRDSKLPSTSDESPTTPLRVGPTRSPREHAQKLIQTWRRFGRESCMLAAQWKLSYQQENPRRLKNGDSFTTMKKDEQEGLRTMPTRTTTRKFRAISFFLVALESLQLCGLDFGHCACKETP